MLYIVYCIGDDVFDVFGVLCYDVVFVVEVLDFVLVDMVVDDLVVIIYMFGMIGKLKGVLYVYCVLFGYLFGVEML